MESGAFEILQKASSVRSSFIAGRTPSDRHPFEDIIKSCEKTYGRKDTLSSLKRLLYATDNSEDRDYLAESISYAYENDQDLWFEMLLKFIVSNSADFFNFTYIANVISGFDVDTNKLYNKLHDMLPDGDKKLDAAGKVIYMESIKQKDLQTDILYKAGRVLWNYDKISDMLTLERHTGLDKFKLRKCFEFAKNHKFADEKIITTSDRVLGDLK